MLKILAAAAMVALAAPPAWAAPGDFQHPIRLKMARGTDSLTVHGVLSQKTECCAYTFKAAAGQQLRWSETGATARMTITYPDGTTDGPGLPNPLPLKESGAYVLGLTPDLMAEGAFGPFTLNLRIPPAR